MTAGGAFSELEWWRAHRDALGQEAGAAREVLARLKAWKARHDQERAHQPPPFLLMAWDGVFGDEDEQVAEAIAQLEAALAGA